MADKITQLLVEEDLYNFADYNLNEMLTKDNEGKTLIIKNNALAATNIQPLEPEVEVNGTKSASFVEVFNTLESGTIKLLKDVVLNEQITLPENHIITIDFNGHNISSSSTLKLTSCLIEVSFNSGLTFDGIGGVFAGSKVYGAVGIAVDKTTSTEEKLGQLIINNGTFVGQYYAVVTWGGKTDYYCDIKINGGTFRTLDKENGVAIYNPAYNSTLAINGGDICGGTGLEVRAGEVTINGGKICGESAFTIVPNGNGATSTGCGVAVVQHTSKQPINLTINGGLISGNYAFYEANPQKNEAEAIAQVQVSLNGGSYVPLYEDKEVIYSEDLTNFVNSKCLIAGTIKDAYRA